MRGLALVLAVLFGNRSAQSSAAQSEVVLAATISTAISIPVGTRSVEIYNNSLWTIWCNPSGVAIAGQSRAVPVGTAWALDASATALSLQCVALLVQVTGAATIVTTLQ